MGGKGMIRYSGGHKIPDNVLAALIYTAKVGVLTTSQWHTYFATGVPRWREQQLQLLEKRRLIKRHPGTNDSKWILDYQAEVIFERRSWPIAPSVSPQHFIHDEVVGESLLRLDKALICKSWLTEREMKSQGFKNYVVMKKDNEVKYPDAIFKVSKQENILTIALEYERTGKSSSRYRSILWQYSRLNDLTI